MSVQAERDERDDTDLGGNEREHEHATDRDERATPKGGDADPSDRVDETDRPGSREEETRPPGSAEGASRAARGRGRGSTWPIPGVRPKRRRRR